MALKTLFKQAMAHYYFRAKAYKSAEELGIEIASEKVLSAALKAMRQSQRGTLKPSRKTFGLTTFISEEGEGQLQIMLKPIVDLCRTYDVKMSYQVLPGPTKSWAELSPNILEVSFAQYPDLSEELSRRNNPRRLSLVHSR